MTVLKRLFDDYAKASLAPDPEAIAAFYGDAFLVAGPRGSAMFPNDAPFLDWLREMHAANQRSGMVSMEVVSIVAETELSPRHVLANVEWGARFEKTGERLITFRISYLLEKSDERFRILAYVSEKDQEEEMRKLGLM